MDIIVKALEKTVAGLVAQISGELAGVRSSRPSPSLVEDLKIDYLGQQMTVKQLGSLSIIPPREMAISLWDPSGTPVVAKALEDAKRGFTVSVRGNAIYLSLPPLSQERRDELAKLVKSMSEKTRIQVRAARDDANKKLSAAKSAKTLTEDMEARGKKKVQEAIDKANKDIDALVEKKTKEINE